MSLSINSLAPATLELHIGGALDKQDYRQFVPLAEALVEEHGRLNLLIHLSGLRGWTPAALWEDIKFDAKHYEDVARIAFVAPDDRGWVAALSRPFTRAEIEAFTEDEIGAARAWVTGERGRHH